MAASFQPRYLNEALLLMAKVHYVQGRYRDAQGMCARVGLEELTRDDQPTYHLRLLAEAFVIKGSKVVVCRLCYWFAVAEVWKAQYSGSSSQLVALELADEGQSGAQAGACGRVWKAVLVREG